MSKTQCLHPIYMPTVTGVMPISCGKCVSCGLKYCQSWTTRLTLHAESYKDIAFVTLTYDDAHFPENGSLERHAIRDFMKNLRNKMRAPKYKDRQKITFFAVGEYGSKTARPHYHLILFGIRPDNGLGDRGDRDLVYSVWRKCDYRFCTVEPLRSNSAGYGYITGYISKKRELHAFHKRMIKEDPTWESKLLLPYMRCSKGIGLEYLEKHHDTLLARFPTGEGAFVSIPQGDKIVKRPFTRYMMRKLYSAKERKECLRRKMLLHYQSVVDEFKKRCDLRMNSRYLFEVSNYRDSNIYNMCDPSHPFYGSRTTYMEGSKDFPYYVPLIAGDSWNVPISYDVSSDYHRVVLCNIIDNSIAEGAKRRHAMNLSFSKRAI